MAYERYDRNDPDYDERRRWRERQEAHGEGRPMRGWEDRYRGREDEDRGFFERAGDEIASWFGDEEAERRRMQDVRTGERSYGREPEYERGRDEAWFGGGNYGRARQERGEGRSYRPMHWTMSDRDYARGYNRFEQGPREYRPMVGEYGRSGREEERRPSGRGSEWDRDVYRRTSFAGSSARSQREDPHYEEWRRRRMEELDRDYDEYRSERQSRFETDFGAWRERRRQKRGLLGDIREHMEVVGSDEQHVGTVDRIAGDRIILTKSDPESGGVHHSLSCTAIDRVEGDRVILDLSAERAKERWRDESRERALFEREDQGRAGPEMLNRSFSGTYR